MDTFIIMDHKLTKYQRFDLIENWKIDRIDELNKKEQKIWENIFPRNNTKEVMNSITSILSKIIQYSYIVLSGELTSCKMINRSS